MTGPAHSRENVRGETGVAEESEPQSDEDAVVVSIETAAAGTLAPPLVEEVPARALVVVAHPDDVDFGAAGTVASWTSRGSDVTYCIVTDGSAGSADPATDPADLREIRIGEQRAAAKSVGVDDVRFLGYTDGSLEPTGAARRDISRVIRSVRPDVVVTQSPERNYERIRASHPDHLAAGEATLRAVYPDARNPYAHPELLREGLEPFEVPQVWLMASPRADHVVDITDFFERKMAALRAHVSQISDPEQVEMFVREFTSAAAQRFGLGADRLAEAFQVVDTR